MSENVAHIISSKVKPQLLAGFMVALDNFDYSLTPPEQQYLVAGLIPSGKVTLLVGAGAVGKTHQILDLSIKIAYPQQDDQWLGSNIKVDGPGTVVFVSAEEDRDDFWSRMSDLGAGDRKGDSDSRIHLLDKNIMAGRPLFRLDRDTVVWTDEFYALWELCRIVKPKMIVIDTLNSLCPVDVDKNSAHGQAVVQALGLIASETGAALICTHHIAKTDITSRNNARAAIKGTTATVDGARCAIVIWQAAEKTGEKAVAAGIVEDGAELLVAAVVKANSKGADMRERYVRRDAKAGGVLRDVSAAVLMMPDDEKPATRGRGRPKKDA